LLVPSLIKGTIRFDGLQGPGETMLASVPWRLARAGLIEKQRITGGFFIASYFFTIKFCGRRESIVICRVPFEFFLNIKRR
jgi:hypothetical protein